ncbi:MAG: hypothetical protein Q8K61_12770 [Gallionella sp.]|nr:hypothetical protein [Gallionella sp.]
MHILFAFLLLIACSSQAATDNPQRAEALRAQEAGDYARAASLFLPLAEKGDAIAQYNMGLLYTQGRVILQDYRIALQWYLAAAEQGHPEAQNKLGELYASGKGVAQDFKKAMNWFLLSAKQGNATAQLHIGDMYAEGQGVPQDYREVFKWYQSAAKQGDAVAHARLAECYEKGLGTAQNSKIAIDWLNTAITNAPDMNQRNAYTARRDEIAQGIDSRKLAAEQKLAREEADRVKAAEAVRAEAERIATEKAAIAQAAEQARQKAAADAALEVQIAAYKQAAAEEKAARLLAQQEEKAAKLKAQQEAKAERDAARANQKINHANSIKAREDQRRAEINAEVARHRAEDIARHKKTNDSMATRKTAKKDEDPDHPLLNEEKTVIKPATAKKPIRRAVTSEPQNDTNPESEPVPQAVVQKAESKLHDIPVKNIKKADVKNKPRYPARIELTDEELGVREPQNGDEPAKTPVKKIEWSKKPATP